MPAGPAEVIEVDAALERFEVTQAGNRDDVVGTSQFYDVLGAGGDALWVVPHYQFELVDGSTRTVPALTDEWLFEVGAERALEPPPSWVNDAVPMTMVPATVPVPAPTSPLATTTTRAPTINTVQAKVTVEIVEIREDVDFYTACGTQPLEFNGVTWYQLPEHEFGDIVATIEAVRREPIPRLHGIARVAPPGPGDDVGTLYVYADDVAWFVSDSGDIVTWLRKEPVEANWVC